MHDLTHRLAELEAELAKGGSEVSEELPCLPVSLHDDPTVENCCLCLRERACVYSGHVTRDAQRVFAGWCKVCSDRLHGAASTRLRSAVTWSIREFLECPLAGWFGHWVPAMGLTTWGKVEEHWAAERKRKRAAQAELLLDAAAQAAPKGPDPR